MDYEKYTELTLEDDKSFIIIDSFELDNNKYLYLINEESKKSSLVKVINDIIYEIEDDIEFNNAFNELVNRNKEELNKLLEETNK